MPFIYVVCVSALIESLTHVPQRAPRAWAMAARGFGITSSAIGPYM